MSETVAAIIKEREMRGWSPIELASRTRVPVRLIRRIEDEQIPLNEPVLLALGQAFGLPVTSLIAENDTFPLLRGLRTLEDKSSN